MTTPNILLTATLRWPIAARLAIVFLNMGCRVQVVCPKQHPVTMLRDIRYTYPYSVFKPFDSLRKAIDAVRPDIIIPCDDSATTHLYQLFLQAVDQGISGQVLRNLIERSLGTPDSCQLAIERGRLMALAKVEQVRVPETTVIATVDDLENWLMSSRFPTVLKIDCTWGGLGVVIVRNRKNALEAFQRMSSRPTIWYATVRTLLDRDPSFMLNTLNSTQRLITAQRYITGKPANRAVVCWQGEVLAGISVEVIKTQHTTGPATVVHVIDNPEMSASVKKLVKRLGVSGFWGVDFVIEASTGFAYLIEVNPRATPITHLPIDAGHNLTAALYTQLTGTSLSVSQQTIDHDVIAMFPGEWHRDHHSPYLSSAYHDVPLDEPALIHDCLDIPWAERGLIARLWAYMRLKSPSFPPSANNPFNSQGHVAGDKENIVFTEAECSAAPTSLVDE